MAQFQRLSTGGPVIETTVKWFSTAKGFGFVAPVDGSPEAFLHMGVLEAAGLPAPAAGAMVKCEIGAGKKGPQVVRVVEVGGGAARPAPSAPASDSGEDARAAMAGAEEIACVVRWYCPVRGYGFLTPVDGTRDVFVNSKALRRSELGVLEKDQRVIGAVIVTPRGREARGVRLT